MTNKETRQMAKTTQYFDRRGRKLDPADALQDNMLRDGVTVRVPLHLADAARSAVRPLRITDARSDAREYWDAERDALLVTDGHGDDLFGLHRPGFRVLDNDFGGTAKRDAYADYNRWTCVAYKTPPTPTAADARSALSTPCPDCGGAGANANGDDCPYCGGRGFVPNSNNNEDRRSIDNRRAAPVDMNQIYQDHARELSERWRKG
jgi:hypothetical protein